MPQPQSKITHTVAPGPPRPNVPRNEGHGRRLSAAFEALEHFPALSQCRDRVLRIASAEAPGVAELTGAIESDLALVVAVMRLANGRPGQAGRIATLPAAIEVLTPIGVEALARGADTFDFFDRSPAWDLQPERFRLHAVATQQAAARIAEVLEAPEREEIGVSALLHDVGKLVLRHAYPGYPAEVHGDARTPERRLWAERRELGVDHALVGGVLARRWGLPLRIASAIERHHAEDAEGAAAVIRLADMVAHYIQGELVSPAELLAAAQACQLEVDQIRAVLFELPLLSGQRPRRVEPSPLSVREMQVLRRLAEGKVYKQIALDLSLSPSTVRTHLHNVYGKLGAVDRAQAVLTAAEKGWI